MTDKEQIAMLRDALEQFQYAAHEVLPMQTDKLKLAVKMGDLALAATAPSAQAQEKVDERAEFAKWWGGRRVFASTLSTEIAQTENAGLLGKPVPR